MRKLLTPFSVTPGHRRLKLKGTHSLNLMKKGDSDPLRPQL